MKTVNVNYKSGKTIKMTTKLTAEQIGKRIKSNGVDINPEDLTLIRWSEVESISAEN